MSRQPPGSKNVTPENSKVVLGGHASQFQNADY